MLDELRLGLAVSFDDFDALFTVAEPATVPRDEEKVGLPSRFR
jgi:hypothetical protein